ncbi:hypothetical protein NGRA_2374 [Nosema granulosis]|uniref:Uncharacterized protein n=1 Tax=Nosema granulosis TaxID=83296 RepID=A0A9P6GWS4_9MICR|nr:hypothetical protein NGRA_2374 [Nosema granulosis]
MLLVLFLIEYCLTSSFFSKIVNKKESSKGIKSKEYNIVYIPEEVSQNPQEISTFELQDDRIKIKEEINRACDEIFDNDEKFNHFIYLLEKHTYEVLGSFKDIKNKNDIKYFEPGTSKQTECESTNLINIEDLKGDHRMYNYFIFEIRNSKIFQENVKDICRAISKDNTNYINLYTNNEPMDMLLEEVRKIFVCQIKKKMDIN